MLNINNLAKETDAARIGLNAAVATKEEPSKEAQAAVAQAAVAQAAVAQAAVVAKVVAAAKAAKYQV